MQECRFGHSIYDITKDRGGHWFPIVEKEYSGRDHGTYRSATASARRRELRGEPDDDNGTWAADHSAGLVPPSSQLARSGWHPPRLRRLSRSTLFFSPIRWALTTYSPPTVGNDD
ncbi:hypothetical protein BHE74_00010609 [Ensete ventricosum]|nr:hypothetical protein GW17_00007339 [Ensete ventricosum]RWW81026.1 hypothetical protein BHE74_00010609 [Ensete ventricosum]RZR79395.1 hypothetical protein BHM03_00005112 [Ensete ventricosum]